MRYAPLPAGHIDFTLVQDGSVIDAMELTLLWRLPDGASEALQRPTVKTTSGFRAEIPPLDVAAWDLEADILIDDFTSLRIQGLIVLR